MWGSCTLPVSNRVSKDPAREFAWEMGVCGAFVSTEVIVWSAGDVRRGKCARRQTAKPQAQRAQWQSTDLHVAYGLNGAPPGLLWRRVSVCS